MFKLNSWIYPISTLSIIFIVMSVFPADVYAQSRIMDEIETTESETRPEIRIRFNLPMQYLTHEPVSSGKTILVQLRPVTSLSNLDINFGEEESLSWKPNKLIPMSEVRYEGNDTGNAQFRINFTRDVKFSVQSSKDYRSLIITLIPQLITKPDTAKQDIKNNIRKPSLPVVKIPAKPSTLDKAAARPKILPAISDKQLSELMETARVMMVKKDYSSAIRLYTKILRYPEHIYTQDAQEFLGLVRERKGQTAHAKAEYEKYLQRYPEGKGAERVKQRLFALTTIKDKPKEKLRSAKRGKQRSEWNVFGSFSQFYRRDANITDQTGETVSQSSLSTDLDISARRRTQDYDIRTRFTGGLLNDFLNNGPGDDSRIISMYADISDLKRGFSGRIGRQSRSSGGVLGRFDGGLFSYQLTSNAKVNLVAGYPVESTSDALQDNRSFYGVSVDLGTYANAWDFVAFAIDQTIDGITDRQAIGGEVRYFHPERSFLSLVDYDTSYDELNTFLVIGNWTLPNKITINSTIDYRKSPLLTTRNALQGQSVTSIDSLLLTNSEEQIRQLALDRTAESRSYTLGLSRPLNSKFQLSGDVTVSNLKGTPASGGVDAIPDTGNDYLYNLQLISSNLLKTGDISILGLRYSDTSTSNTTSFLLNSRYPVNTGWRINPRLRFDYRNNLNDDSNQWTIAPSIRSEYRWRRKYRFEVEMGGEHSNLKLTDTTDKTSSYFLSLGYRVDF